MSKRASERQITKDDYEDGTHDAYGGEESSHGTQQASQETLRQRRIIRARRPPTTDAVNNTTATSAASSSNPFAAVNLLSTAGTSSSPAPAPSFSFGAASSSTVTAQPTVASTASSLFVQKSSADLNRAYTKKIVSMMNSQADWSEIALVYRRRAATQIWQRMAARQQQQQRQTFAPIVTLPTAAAAPAAAAVPPPGVSPSLFQQQQQQQQAPMAATTATTTTAENSKSSPAPTAPAPAPPPADANEQEEFALAAPAAVTDGEWQECKSFDPVIFYYKKDDGNYVKFCKGKLLLQKSTTNNTKRMVLREGEQGLKVNVNMRIAPGTQYEMQIHTAAKTKKEFGQILFAGINSEERGFEHFAIKATPSTARELHEMLMEWSSQE